MRELGVEKLDQADAGLWQDIAASLIVDSALFASMYATYGDYARLVEMRHGQNVLSLPIFNNEVQIGPMCIDGKRNPTSPGIT